MTDFNHKPLTVAEIEEGLKAQLAAFLAKPKQTPKEQALEVAKAMWGKDEVLDADYVDGQLQVVFKSPVNYLKVQVLMRPDGEVEVTP